MDLDFDIFSQGAGSSVARGGAAAAAAGENEPSGGACASWTLRASFPPLARTELANLPAATRSKIDEIIFQAGIFAPAKAGAQEGSVTYYDGFAIDTMPTEVDFRSVQSCSDVKGWARPPLFEPAGGMLVPLPLARAPPDPTQRRAGNQCFNCGSTEHGVANCPQPRDAAAINLRRNAQQKEQGARPSWTSEPRYFVKPKESVVAHLAPGKLSEDLRKALGIPLDHSAPPPYLAMMVEAGYPPGWVVLEGGEDAGKANGERPQAAALAPSSKRLTIHTGGDDMEFSDDEGAGGGGKKGGEKRKTVKSVVFEGAFEAPLPVGAIPALWSRVSGGARPSSAHTQHSSGGRYDSIGPLGHRDAPSHYAPYPDRPQPGGAGGRNGGGYYPPSHHQGGGGGSQQHPGGSRGGGEGDLRDGLARRHTP